MQNLRPRPSEEGFVPGFRDQGLHGLQKSVPDVLHSGITSEKYVPIARDQYRLFGGERRANRDQGASYPLRKYANVTGVDGKGFFCANLYTHFHLAIHPRNGHLSILFEESTQFRPYVITSLFIEPGHMIDRGRP